MDLALILKVTIALATGLAAAAVARRAPASARHLMLAATFSCLVIIPAVPHITAPINVPVPSAATTIAAVVPDVHVRDAATQMVETIATDAPRNTRLPLSAWLTMAWAAGALVLTASLVRALFVLSRLRRQALPWPEGQALLDAVAREAGLTRSVDVLQQEAIDAPVTWGLRRPVVLMPADADTWVDRDLRQAFLHELEHIHRGDWIVQVACRVLCAVYWFHPLVWIAWRQLCLESERACDDAVLRRSDGTSYAQQLVSLARRVSTASTVPMLSMAGRSDLSVRVRALLDTTVRRQRASRRMLIVTASVVALAAVALSPLRAAQVEPPTMPAATADDATSGDAVVAPIAPAPTRVAARSDATRPAAPVATVIENFAETLEAKAEHLQDTVVDTLRGRHSRGSSHVGRALAEDFIAAAQAGDVEAVTAMMNDGMDPNTVLPGDGTALIAASRHGRLAVVKRLIDRGADVNLASPGDGNPLIMASARGAEDVVDYLLKHGADVETIVPGDENPLISASGNGHLEVVKLLIKNGANPNAGVWVDRWDGPGRPLADEYRSPLSMAIKGGHANVANYLRKQGAQR